MKIICISDIHGLFNEFAYHQVIGNVEQDYSGDVLVCAGDITNCGELDQIQKFCKWVKRFNCSHYITVAGNHDWCFERAHQKQEAKKILEDGGIIYLENQEVILDGIKFWGSPATREFCNWAFNYTEKQLQRLWETIPDDVNVLITHSMPKDILDYTPHSDENVGEIGLPERIKQLDHLKLYVGGHLHHFGGSSKNYNDVIYVNASICNEQYNPINSPIIVDI